MKNLEEEKKKKTKMINKTLENEIFGYLMGYTYIHIYTISQKYQIKLNLILKCFVYRFWLIIFSVFKLFVFLLSINANVFLVSMEMIKLEEIMKFFKTRFTLYKFVCKQFEAAT